MRVSWEVALLRFRDGVEVELDTDLVAQIFERHGVVDVDAPEYLYRDPADPESLWTTIYLHAQAVMFYRPTVGSVWNLIFGLMQECGAVLHDPSGLMVLPSEEMRTSLPPDATFRAVRVASTVEELLTSLG